MKPKALVLRAPGTNCDRETGYAFELAGGQADLVHINQIIESPEMIRQYQILCVAGGFSFGDDVGAGRILASQFSSHLKDCIEQFRADGKLVLGICNGFQVLIKTGFLVPPDRQGIPVTLTWNHNGKYTCQWVHLKSVGAQCVFLKDLDSLYLPIAHAEGRFVVRDSESLARVARSTTVGIEVH